MNELMPSASYKLQLWAVTIYGTEVSSYSELQWYRVTLSYIE